MVGDCREARLLESQSQLKAALGVTLEQKGALELDMQDASQELVDLQQQVWLGWLPGPGGRAVQALTLAFLRKFSNHLKCLFSDILIGNPPALGRQ